MKDVAWMLGALALLASQIGLLYWSNTRAQHLNAECTALGGTRIQGKCLAVRELAAPTQPETPAADDTDAR